MLCNVEGDCMQSGNDNDTNVHVQCRWICIDAYTCMCTYV